MLYLAYGSNMSPEQMRRRCPRARLLGAVTLHGYRLTFAGSSVIWNGGGVATIVREPECEVRGAVYEIDADDLGRLDQCEGVPFCYIRTRREVALDGQKRRPWVYVKPRPRYNPPSMAYLRRIAEGWQALGLDLHEFVEAVNLDYEIAEAKG